MNKYLLLLKEQLVSQLPNVRNKKNIASTLSGLMLTVFLYAAIIAIFVVIFGKFVATYTTIRINRTIDIAARQYEIMSVVYFVLFLVGVSIGVSGFAHSLFEDGNMHIILTMPFSANEIFLSHLTAVYVRQIVFTAIFVMPVNFTFFAVTSTYSTYNVLLTITLCFLLPIIALCVASIIILPYCYLKQKLLSHYGWTFIILTLMTAGFCFVYAQVFTVAGQLLSSGKITSLFNERVMLKIIAFSAKCFPANYLANLILGRDVWRSMLMLSTILVVCSVTGFFIVKAIFIKLSQLNMTIKMQPILKTKPHFARRGRLVSLISKEFLSVLKTPDYTFMYFSTALALPVITYYSAATGTRLMTDMLNLRLNFEICTFVVILYSTLSNTFCATNISRDGYMAMSIKALPYSADMVLRSKIIFCAIIAEISLIATTVVLCATGLESLRDALVTLLAASMIALAQIVFATKLDLRRPHFAKMDDGEIKESNSSVSTVIIVALGSSFALGGVLLLNAVKALLGGTPVASSNVSSYLLALGVPAILLVCALLFYFRKLSYVYNNLNTEA